MTKFRKKFTEIDQNEATDEDDENLRQQISKKKKGKRKAKRKSKSKTQQTKEFMQAMRKYVCFGDNLRKF